MTSHEFQTWLDAYGRAWQARDAEAAADLFTDGAAYHEAPFVEPMRGRNQIFVYWSHVARTQEQIRFRCEILSVATQHGIAHGWTSFVRVPEQTHVKLDGIFLVTLRAYGRCETLREWWQRKQTRTDQTADLSPNLRRASPPLPDPPTRDPINLYTLEPDTQRAGRDKCRAKRAAFDQ
ncbi:MAG TPA: nuclear transport factor 2 family protein [Terriglobia bacterium]|nr:nuclear transport factor 2 family protein [Terriglobia bacterium]